MKILKTIFSNRKKNIPSHHIHHIIPKPESAKIEKMVAAYYSEQAHEYDFFDTEHKTRSLYTKRINELIANDLKRNKNIENFLTIACGTGRRAIDIRKKSGLDYKIIGIDISIQMGKVAEKRGIHMIYGSWLDVKLPKKEFGAASFLYSFGHIPTREKRKESLLKINHYLRKGASLYLDVFNLNDKNEWGPRALKTFEERKLYKTGYDKGDVFYKKTGGKEIAFLHYFEKDEIVEILEKTGFKIVSIKYLGYVKRSGEILKNENEGAFFIKAVKK